MILKFVGEQERIWGNKSRVNPVWFNTLYNVANNEINEAKKFKRKQQNG